MNDFQGLLSSDYGFKPQGKAAPMAPPRPNPSTGTANSSAFDLDIGGGKTSSYSKSSYSSSVPLFDDHDTLFRSSSTSRSDQEPNDFGNLGILENVFSGSSKSTANSSVNMDSIFSRSGESEPKFSSLPVFDKPVYDEDVFDGVSGLKSSSSAQYQDFFSSASLPPPSVEKHDAFGELLGGLGRKESEANGAGGSSSGNGEKGVSGLDDLLPGFGSNGDRASSDRSWVPKSPASETKKASTGPDGPFVVLNSNSPPAPSSPGVYSDPMEQISKQNSCSGKKAERYTSAGDVFDDLDPLAGFGKSVPLNSRENSGGPVRTGSGATGRQNSLGREESDRFGYVRSPERVSKKKMPTEDFHEPSRNIYDIRSNAADSDRPLKSSSPSNTNSSSERTSYKHTVRNEGSLDSFDDAWLIVSEVPLYTQPTVAPPPSRPPPPRPPKSKAMLGSFARFTKIKGDEYPPISTSAQAPQASSLGGKSSFVSPIDELEDFAKSRIWGGHDGNGDGEAFDTNSVAAASAAAMKEAMDRAEARFRHAKGVRERENAKSARMHNEKEDRTVDDSPEREYRQRQDRLEHERIEREEEERRQKEEEERMRIEREREIEEREKEKRKKERDLARQAMERATREARERAAAEARARADKAAVEKVHAETRGRAERAAVLRAQAEARERAAHAAAEAKQKADREKAEREARERAEREAKGNEARDKAARANQQRNEDDLESLFGGGSRASSAPRPRASSSSKQPESVRSSVGSAASMRKASSSTNIVDDLSSIFGAAPSAGEFQDIEGETEERRKARLERHQRTRERAAKALAEKNQRDLDAQREQAERHRIAETLDIEIKRWAAGKEGNLRALLSTLQYVLWPESGWHPVSLTDLINGASVKKVYRKATLCIHPDKVQQKGATLQQKYIAEKVFDLLKEAWNKFNSEELF